MVRVASTLLVAVAMSGAIVAGQAQAPVTQKPGTEKITPQAQAAAKNLIEEIKTVGCIRLWKPAPDDPTKMPPDRQPGLAGIYLLTPVASSPTTSTDLPTYLLTPSATLNFSQHVGHRVEVTGNAQTAPLPPTVQEIATAPTMRPENKPSTNGMPRLTVTTMKMISEGCP
ncbi:MAG TPA: hypothetical protein VEA16_00020 [Vicinamibacterales bacterium]|nr:hypothetical protein [Vicinamibacterales bacterium]